MCLRPPGRAFSPVVGVLESAKYLSMKTCLAKCELCQPQRSWETRQQCYTFKMQIYVCTEIEKETSGEMCTKVDASGSLWRGGKRTGLGVGAKRDLDHSGKF